MKKGSGQDEGGTGGPWEVLVLRMRNRYAGGRLPSSRFSALVSECMCQDSKRQHCRVNWLESITSASDQLMGCPVANVCFARAETTTSPFLTARWCSFIQWERDRPVWPMYVFWQVAQGI